MSQENETKSPSNHEPFSESPEQVKIPIMLGLFDVLGFSKRLEADGLDNVVALYNHLISETVKKEAKRCLGLKGDGTGKRYMVAFALNVRYAYFSDTILLWVPLESLFAAPFIAHCNTFVCEALAMNVPVRGAIALGEAVMHRPSSIYIGAPIVEAARLEKDQNWIGVSLAHSATWPPFLAELEPKSIIEYDVPAKAKDELSGVVLDWPRRWRELNSSSPKDKLSEMNEHTPHPYYGNTIPFVEYSKANEDWYLRPEEEMQGARLRMGPSNNSFNRSVN
jgi:hypothetical protein